MVYFSEFPDKGVFRAGGAWIRGCLEMDSSVELVDSRAWIGQEITYGVCGEPAAGRGGCAMFTAVSFEILLQPSGGRHELSLEFFDAILGGWREYYRCEIWSDAPKRSLLNTAQPGPNAGWVMLRTLRMKNVQPWYSWKHHAHEAWLAALTRGLELTPIPPIYGRLEEPSDCVRYHHGRLSVNGWVAHTSQAIVQITAYVDPRIPTRLVHGLPRSDVATKFAHLRNAAHCQFSGEVVVPVSHPRPWGLVINVELDDGSQVLTFYRRVLAPSFAVDIPGELPTFSALHFCVATATTLWVQKWRGLARSFQECVSAKKTYLQHASPFVALPNICYDVPRNRDLCGRHSIVIVNDNFILGGAALFAFEYARFLSQQLGWSVRLASPHDGPLRALCVESGIQVEIVDASLLAAETSPSIFYDRIALMAAKLDWHNVDMVIANTMVVHWAVHLAQALNKPAFFYIHESSRIDALFAPMQVPMVEKAMTVATRTIFLTEWTRSSHRDLANSANFRLLRSWTDSARIDIFSAKHDRLSLRRAHGIPKDAIVIVCLGSICDRKGQRLLVSAIEHLVKRAAGLENRSTLQILLVGATPSPDVDQLQQDIAFKGLGELIGLIAETPEALRYLRIADIYVCPSFEEGFPRALMEAAVLGLQIVTTSVCGIPEMLSTQDAWLVPPGEPALLSDALTQAMRAHRAGDLIRSNNARARVRRLYDAADVLPDHAALIADALVPTA